MDEFTVDTLAQALQEPNRALLLKVLRTVGQARCAVILADTLQCEAKGGMLTKDGTRRRTPGGVFFQLVKERVTPQERRRLFPPPAAPRGQGHPQQQAQGQPPALTWDEARSLMQTLATESPGEARTMKLTLIGRPGKVETRGQAVVFRMQGKPPGALPRGLPPVPAQAPLTWTVMVALRQWNRVKDSVAANQDDQLIIEGYPLLQGTQPVLLAQSCVSMLQQRAQKQAQRQQAETTP
jgi:PHAX RNA-binding domain